jgi:ATP-grasp ribosomal peptide maturase
VTAHLVPLGAKAPAPAFVVTIDPSSFTYDEDRQVNVTADGGLWAHEPVAASSTATNNDTSPGNPPDEDSDPYAFPEPEPEHSPAAHRLTGSPRPRSTMAAPRSHVLVVAEQLDPTADLVVQALTERGVPVLRFDLAEFPQAVGLAAEHQAEAPGWTGTLVRRERAVPLSDVRAVYYRRPGLPLISPDVAGIYREWALSQALVGMVQVLASLPVEWMHHPDVYRSSAHKPGQLVTATSVGLRVPRSFLGNDLAAAQRWAQAIGGPLASKPIAAASLQLPESPPTMIPTRRIEVSELDESLELTAHYLQEWIPKDHEIRLTVVGRQMFPVAIHANSDQAKADWRSDYDALEYEPVPIPDDIAEGVRRFMACYRLNYGAFDFAVLPNGQWIFYECNPAGQWQFIAKATGLPIAEAHASLLTGTSP